MSPLPAETPRLGGPLLVDGHVHYYSCYRLDRFLDAALENFRWGARSLGLPGIPTGCLLLTEAAGQHWFRHWSEKGGGSEGGWMLRPAEDGLAILAEREGVMRLVLVAGRQLGTAEGLEVLAVGCAQDFPAGLDLDRAVRVVADAGAVTIVPWGFGKWWLGRGGRVRRLIESLDPASGAVFLGDNGGRPRVGREPRLLAQGRARGLAVLPGSDPLPFEDQAQRVGSLGFVLDGSLQTRHAGADLVDRLKSLREQPPTFGRLETLSGFIRSQARMQWRKRLGARPG